MAQTELVIKMILDRWYGSINNCNTILNALTDEQLEQTVAPGKNSGKYLLGHLIAVHDAMLELLDKGEKMYPELYEPFIKESDGASNQTIAIAELRKMWTTQCEAMQQILSATSTEEWFSKHTAVTEEDFMKEPQRNKLNIVITRTSHLQYHSGQLVLLKKN